MKRTQISLPEEQWRRAKQAAEDRGISLAGLVRRALEEMLRNDDWERRRDRAREAVGGYHSGHADTSTAHDEVLADNDRW